MAVNPSVTVRFHEARSIPSALKEKVEQELQKLEDLGIISAVTYSHWGALIVQNGNTRICGDYCVMVNQDIKIGSYTPWIIPYNRLATILGICCPLQFFKNTLKFNMRMSRSYCVL